MAEAKRFPALASAACFAVIVLAVPAGSSAQGRGAAEEGLELVDPNVLRVCADPTICRFPTRKAKASKTN